MHHRVRPARPSREREHGLGWCLALVLTCSALTVLAFAAPAGANWPDPGGDADAEASVPPPDKYFGLNGAALDAGQGLRTGQLVELAGVAGANAVRAPLNWQSVEPKQNQWNDGTWAQFDRFYDAARATGLTPIMVLGNAPWWARGLLGKLCLSNSTCAHPPRPQADGEWVEFAAEAARRYPRAIFEIWNEPNLWGYWQSGPNPARYARLQVLAYDAIKAVNPDAMVLSGGLANSAQSALLGLGPMAMHDFLRRAYSAPSSIKGHMDALAFHPYPERAPSGYSGLLPNLGETSGYARAFHQIRAVRDAAGDAGTPLFVTETAISTTAGVSREGQADATRRLYRKTLSMDDVIGVVLHRIGEPPNPLNQAEQGYAWVRSRTGYPPPPYPVFCAFVADAGNTYDGC